MVRYTLGASTRQHRGKHHGVQIHPTVRMRPNCLDGTSCLSSGYWFRISSQCNFWNRAEHVLEDLHLVLLALHAVERSLQLHGSERLLHAALGRFVPARQGGVGAVSPLND